MDSRHGVVWREQLRVRWAYAVRRLGEPGILREPPGRVAQPWGSALADFSAALLQPIGVIPSGALCMMTIVDT